MEIIDRPENEPPLSKADAQYHQMQQQDLSAQLGKVASWFYLIGGLSFVNTIMVASGADWSFFLGLGFTQVVDGVILAAFGEYHWIGYVINGIVAGMFVLFGVLFVKRHQWPLIVGMVIYALDAVIFVYVGLWFAVLFHGYVLYRLWRGHVTLRDALKEKPFRSGQTTN